MPQYRVTHSYNVQRTYFITCSEEEYEEKGISLDDFCNSETLDESYDSWEHEDCIESKRIDEDD